MKQGKLKGLLAVGLAFVVASGCSHTPQKTTKWTSPNNGDQVGGRTANPSDNAGLGTGQGKRFGEEFINRANWAQFPSILFDYDRAVIRESERAKLETMAAYLKANPHQAVLVAGHCDERGTAEYNRALGERRAAAAREYLIKLGIAADRIGTISYGKDRPAEFGHDEASRAKNRRDEFGIGSMATDNAEPLALQN